MCLEVSAVTPPPIFRHSLLINTVAMETSKVTQRESPPYFSPLKNECPAHISALCAMDDLQVELNCCGLLFTLGGYVI